MNIQQTEQALHLANMIVAKYSKIIRDIKISEESIEVDHEEYLDVLFVSFFVTYPKGTTIDNCPQYRDVFESRRRVIANSLKLLGYSVTEYRNGLIKVTI